jgi:hypothetical protein
MKRWNSRFDVAWFSSRELVRFRKTLVREISQKAKPVHGLVQQLSRIELELGRRGHDVNNL